MPHFFISSNSITNGEAIISDKETYTHIARALRAKVGEKISLIDENQVQIEGKITEISTSEIKIKVGKTFLSKKRLPFELTLVQSPLKSDAQNSVIEKSTELGVSAVIPVMTDFCAVKKEVAEKKIPKWQKIMAETSKQCERAFIPTCLPLSTLQKLNGYDRLIVFAERNFGIGMKDYFQKNPIKKNEKMFVLIGPEGGFSPCEFEYFVRKGFPLVSLGNLILKADTAAVVALGNLIYEYKN